MYKVWILGAALLICTVGLQARSSAAQPEAVPSSDDESKRVTLEGCLQRSDWQYFLYEKDGAREQLGGYSKLKDFVGHEIEVTGVRTVKTVDNTPPGGASSVTMQPIVNVKAVKDLGKGCTGS